MNRIDLLTQADQLVARGLIKEAVAAYRKLYAASPGDQGVAIRLGDLLIQAGQEAEAARIFKVLAQHLQWNGHDKKAMALLKRVLKLAPLDMEAAAQLSELLVLGGTPREAVQVHQRMAEEFRKHRRLADALAALTRAVTADPTDLKARFALAEALLESGQKDRTAGVYLDAAEALLHARRLPDAKAALDRAAELGFSAKLALLQSRFHLMNATPNKAVHALKEALRQWPGAPVLQESLALAQMEAGHPRSCLENLGQMRSPEPRLLPLAERAIRAMLAEHKLNEALQAYRPLAEGLAMRGSAEDACQSLQRAAEGFEHAALKVFVGEMMRMADRKEDAIQALNDALSLAQLAKTNTLRNRIRGLIQDIARTGKLEDLEITPGR